MTMNSVNDRLGAAEDDSKYDGYIVGEVVENDDPTGQGRIKVKVPDLFEPDKGPNPWIGPHKQSPFGIGPGYGVYGSPAIGSKVRIKLQEGDPHYALFEAGEYDKAAANPKFADPKTWGFKDPSGNELFVNYGTGQWEFTHSSGLSVKYDAAGDRTTHIAGNDNTTVDKSLAINVGQSISITAGTDTTLNTTTLTVNGTDVVFNADTVSTSSVFEAGNGATGTFISKDNKTITVAKGIIVSIVG